MTKAKALRSLGVVGLLSLTTAACLGPDDSVTTKDAELINLKAYWADAKRLDLGDLSRVAVNFASQELDVNLGNGTLGASFDPPAVFAAAAEPSSVLPDGTEIKALNTIVSGLAARFGERELSTSVNKARLDHLQQSSDDYYVESGFRSRIGLGESWRLPSPGFDANTSLGFNAGGEVSSRVIVAVPNDRIDSLVRAPLEAAKGMRGFLYPRSLDDVRTMKPGEMFALRGNGRLGANFGLGVPLLFAEPTGFLSYQIVASAGVSGVISGQVDVQLVRLAGDEVVVDIGVQDGKSVSFHVGISDNWGVKGICDDGIPCLRPVNLGGKTIDLAKMAETAIAKRLNSYLTFSVSASKGQASSRVSLSRFRFHLDRGNQVETETALKQLLMFDLRYAQALYNRDLDQAAPAVIAEVDALRTSTTSTRNFGFELFGMNIFHKAIARREGAFTVQTPDGTSAILFDSLQKNGGWFQNEHGFTRTGVAAQTIDQSGFRSEANLFVQTAVGDKHMDDDLISDNVDALLLGVAGPQVVTELDKFGNALERKVWERCPVQDDNDRRTFDEACNVRLLDEPVMKDLKAQGLAAIEPHIASLPNDYKELVRAAANTRLSLQSVGIHNFDATNGPNASFSLDVRFDDRALDVLTHKTKDEYRWALREYLTAIRANRREIGASKDKNAVRLEVDEKWGRDMVVMADRFEERSKAYARIADTERRLPQALAGKRFVSYPMGVRFTVERDDAKTIESAVISSTSQERARAAAALFDGLREEADEINCPLYDEHTVTFPLLQLVPRQNVEVGMTIGADVRSTFWNSRERYLKTGFKSVSATAKGADVSTISGGMFDIRSIVNQ
jgi:hypothetical protein